MDGKELLKKWSGLINDDNAKPIKPASREAAALILESQEKYHVESQGTTTTDMINFTKIMVPVARRIFPQLLANNVVGIQPTNRSTGHAYALRYSYAGVQQPGMPGVDRSAANADTAGMGEINAIEDLERVQRQPSGDRKKGPWPPTNKGEVINPGGFKMPTNQPDFRGIAIILDQAITGEDEFKVGAELKTNEATPVTLGTIMYREENKCLVNLAEGKKMSDVAGSKDGVVNAVKVGAFADAVPVQYLTNNEAGYDIIFKYYSGNPDAEGGWYTTQQGEMLGTPGYPMKEMKFSLERKAYETKSRKLKARYTQELATDLQNEFNINAETQLINILEYEIVAEIDRDLVDCINGCATKTTGWWYDKTKVSAGTGVGADGRWEAEKMRVMYTKIIKEANFIQKTTRRGSANIIIASTNVVTALQNLRNFMPWSLDSNMDANSGGVTRVGTLDNRFAVYMDSWTFEDYVTLAYKGADNFDTGIVYCPYVMLTLHKAVDSESFQPVIGFSTRAAIVDNIWGAQQYYRTFGIDFSGSSLEGVLY